MTEQDGTYEVHYAVLCGYEIDPSDLVKDLIPDRHRYLPQIIAQDRTLNQAAHMVRTLDEQGEGEMCYYMIPQTLMEVFHHGSLPGAGYVGHTLEVSARLVSAPGLVNPVPLDFR